MMLVVCFEEVLSLGKIQGEILLVPSLHHVKV